MISKWTWIDCGLGLRHGYASSSSSPKKFWVERKQGDAPLINLIVGPNAPIRSTCKLRTNAMRILLGSFLFALLLSISALAQDNEEWPSLSYLRSDYRSVSAVAHVKVTDAEIVSRIPGYENWRIVCEIVEPFKGQFQKGQTVVFFHG